MSMRFDREDNGNCRVYYTEGTLLYCWQKKGPALWYFYRCSKDGEPSHQVTHGDLANMPMPPGEEAIGRELVSFLLVAKANKPELEITMHTAIELLREARKFDNETVISHQVFARYRRKLDAFLAKIPNDEPTDSYDTKERKEHRAYVDSLFNHGRPIL